MKIAVIGSGGPLGSAIARWWNTPAVTFGGESADDRITGLDLPDFNVASRRFTLDTLGEIAPEVIVNCAALRFIDWAESHPNTARTIHVQGTANLRQAADRLGALLVQISCAEVFGDTDPDAPPRTEDDRPAPESVFAKTKLDSERAASQAGDFLIVRASTLFGEAGEQSAGNIADTILKSSRRTRSLRVLDDRKVSPTYTVDFLRGLRFLIHSGARGVYHLVNSGVTTPAQFAKALLAACGLTRHEIEGITSEQYGEIAPHSRNLTLSAGKYAALAGAPPMRPWEEALRDFIARRQASLDDAGPANNPNKN